MNREPPLFATDADDDRFVDILVAREELLNRDGARSTLKCTAADAHMLAEADSCIRLLEALPSVFPNVGEFSRLGSTAPWHLGDLAQSSESSARIPKTLGPFKILCEVGRGGYGLVFLANDSRTDKNLALKIPHGELLFSLDARKRFVFDGKIALTLKHPNLAEILEVGEIDGVCYIASEYYTGGTLAQWLRNQGSTVPFQQAARVVEVLAEAAEYIHGQGILHRDLKPTNVLLERAGETPRDSNAFGFNLRITDFGLAKALGSDTSRSTMDGIPVGTNQYMSYEQAKGLSRLYCQATDVYGLGAILYELITGRPPFMGETRDAILRKVEFEDPISPVTLRPDTPRDLETICLKCLEKSPDGRYATAAALADDLGRFLRNEPIEARPIGAPERVRRYVVRKPAAAIAYGIILAVFVAVGMLAKVRADAQDDKWVQTLESAPIQEVAWISENLGVSRSSVRARLERIADSSANARSRVNACLALLREDPKRMWGLFEPLISARFPDDYRVFVGALRTHRAAIEHDLWLAFEDFSRSPSERLNALCALAAFGSESEKWSDRFRGKEACFLLAKETPESLKHRIDELRPALPRMRAVIDEQFYLEMAGTDSISLALMEALPPDSESFKALSYNIGRGTHGRRERLVGLLARHGAIAVEPLKRLLENPVDRPAPAPNALSDSKPEDSVVLKRAAPRTRAAAAVALLELGRADLVWPYLPRDEKTPETQAFLIEAMGKATRGLAVIMERLASERDPSALQALILALGDQVRGSTDVNLLRSASDVGERFYMNQDPGVHSAAEWLLRTCRREDLLRELEKTAPREFSPGRRWYVNSNGHTMIVVPAGMKYRHARREFGNDPIWETKTLGYAFAAASAETTIAQYEKMSLPEIAIHLEPGREAKHANDEYVSRTPDSPRNSVSWSRAARYCQWLSRQEGIADAESCFGPIDTLRDLAIRPDPGYLPRKGYRLPSVDEAECMAQAGSVQRFFLGDAIELLPTYAWEATSAGHRAGPAGLKKPNPLGLFDVEGNLLEWSMTPVPEFEGNHFWYGTSFVFRKELVGVREISFANNDWPNPSFGFRVACTVPSRPESAREDVSSERTSLVIGPTTAR